MTWYDEVQVCPVFAYQSPADETVTSHGSRTVYRLYFPNRSFMILDEVPLIWSDGEGAASVENDVDHFIVRSSREKCGDKVGIKI